MPSQVQQDDLGGSCRAHIGRQIVIAAAMVRGTVNEDQDPFACCIIKPVGECIAITRAELLQRWQIRGGLIPLGGKAEDVRLRRHWRKRLRNRHDSGNKAGDPEHDQNDDSTKQVAQSLYSAIEIGFE